MNRKIGWKSGKFDKIELVYEKAEKNKAIGRMLEKLEEMALMEAQNSIILLQIVAGDQKKFDDYSDEEIESIIEKNSEFGLAEMKTDIRSSTIVIRLAPQIQGVLACTIFYIMNRLERLEGTINSSKQKWTLELQVPLGGKKGLVQWEMLIMQLHPWISVREVATNQVAVEAIQMPGKAAGSEEPVHAPEKAAGSEESSPANESFKKLTDQVVFPEGGKKPAAFSTVSDGANAEAKETGQTGKRSTEHQGKSLPDDQWPAAKSLSLLSATFAGISFLSMALASILSQIEIPIVIFVGRLLAFAPAPLAVLFAIIVKLHSNQLENKIHKRIFTGMVLGSCVLWIEMFAIFFGIFAEILVWTGKLAGVLAAGLSFVVILILVLIYNLHTVIPKVSKAAKKKRGS